MVGGVVCTEGKKTAGQIHFNTFMSYNHHNRRNKLFGIMWFV